MSKLAVMVKILALLQTHSLITTREMSHYLETSERNIKAYIEDLKTAGVPIEGISGRNGGRFLSSDYYFNPPKLDEGEYASLLMAEKLLVNGNGFPYEKELKTAISKIKWAMGETVVNKGLTEPVNFVYSQSNTDISNEIKDKLSLINQAIRERRKLNILYHNPNKKESKYRCIDPYNLIYRNASWYLIGYCHLRDDIRMLKVIRIKNVSLSEETFSYPLDFSINRYMEGMLNLVQGKEYKIEIQFYHPASVWVEEKLWLPSQKIIHLKDDSIIFKARVKGLVDAKRWVLGYGRLARVIKPEELKKEVGEEIERMREWYKD